MRLLDLYCGAGGAAMGYYRAGFTDIVGVDIAPQKRYPFKFVQMDALEYLRTRGADWIDLIHASPPCQRYCAQTPVEHRDKHPDLIAPTRELLMDYGVPYVIENVPGAHHQMRNPIRLCGSMFGLPIRRHRYFECVPQLTVPMKCDHSKPIIYITGSTGNSKSTFRRVDAKIAEKRAAMEIDWMVTSEIDQAIPPAYTEWIGKQLTR